MSDEKPMDRRRFFREGLRHLFGQVEKAAAPVQRFAEEFAKLDQPANQPTPAEPKPAPRPVTLPLVLRPPGAVPEASFLSTCSRCGDCVKACPAQCIVIDPNVGGGAPHIMAERAPCTVCEELACMNACPTGALQLVPRFAINMGKAVWGEGKCVRGDGDECTKCLDICPMGSAAIDLNEQGQVVVHQSCVGCGQCQYVCPTTPRAIVVVPTKY